jgi:formate/nitrite transporter FocA (FNT family)
MTTPQNDDPPAQPHAHFDALLPSQIARRAEDLGVVKAGMDGVRLFVLAILAGAFIGLGAMAATTMWTGTEGIVPFGIARMLGGLVFSLGLILVVLGGAELFTALGTALLVFLAGHHLLADGAVGKTALAIGEAKSSLPFVRAFFMGILCNVLVCLAVWICYGARTTTDKLLAVLLPIAAFVAAGFEHSVANMYFVPNALMIQAWAGDEYWSLTGGAPSDYPALSIGGLVANLIPVTAGNIIGGGVLVGLVYWFVYLRPSAD